MRFITHADKVTDGGAAAPYCRTRYRNPKPFALRAVHGSASVRDSVLCVTVVNTHPAEAVELELVLRRAQCEEVEVVTLAAEDIHAHNTFAQPDFVHLSAPVTLQVRGDRVRIPLPAGSVARVQGSLV